MKPAGRRASLQIFVKIKSTKKHQVMDEEEDEQENPALHDAPPLVANSYKQANKYLEEVKRFLESKGHIKDAFTIGSVVDNIPSLQLAAARQTTLDSWLRD